LDCPCGIYIGTYLHIILYYYNISSYDSRVVRRYATIVGISKTNIEYLYVPSFERKWSIDQYNFTSILLFRKVVYYISADYNYARGHKNVWRYIWRYTYYRYCTPFGYWLIDVARDCRKFYALEEKNDFPNPLWALL